MGWYGRQMASYPKNGVIITNTYDVEGIRGSKTVNGSKTTYQYIDGQLQYEKRVDSSKLISVYANKDAQRLVKSSSAGIYINIVDFNLDISGGMDDIGISGSLKNGNTTNFNVSISVWAIVAAYILVTTGQYVQSPAYAK